MKQFKIDKVDDFYLVLKPTEFVGGFEKHGKKYNCRGLVSLLKNSQDSFIKSKEIDLDIEKYEEFCRGRKKDYFNQDANKYRKFREE
jgi:hypothetical protein